MLESIWTVGEQVLILFILSGVGFALGKAKMIGDKFSRDASQLVMYVVSPCMMVVAFQRSFENEVFHNFCMALLLSLQIHLLSITVAQLFLRKKNRKGRGPALQRSSLQQRLYGLSLQTALLGTIGIFYGSAYVTVFTLCSWTYGLMQMSGGRVKASAKTLLLNPGVISVVVAMALYFASISLPEVILAPVTYLSQLNTPPAHGHCRLPAFPGQSSLGSPGSGHLVGHLPAAYCHAPNVPGPVSVASR